MTRSAGAQYLGVINGVCGIPYVRRMTIFADVACLNMRGRLASCLDTVVAADTVAGDIHMIEIRRQPGNGGMTVVAGVIAIDMGGMLARCGEAIVAGAAGAKDLSMVHGIGRYPDIAVVTILADVRRLDVSQILACSINTVVTAGAIAGDSNVIKCRRSPGVACMAIVAGIATGDMRWMLAGRDETIVTGTTATDDLCMVDCEGRRKDIGVVTVFANITRLNVCQIFTGRIHAIVTVDATTGDVQVIEIRWQPAGSGMAVITRIAARYVVEVFARCGESIVTGTAVSDDLQVIDCINRRECTGVVTVFANDGGLYVCRVFTRRGCSVVAAGAVVEDIRVIEIRRQPGATRVTAIAVGTARDVRGGLAGRGYPIMAGTAFAQHLCVVDGEGGCPNVWIVAVLTNACCLDMADALARRLDTIVAADAIAGDIYVVKVGR